MVESRRRKLWLRVRSEDFSVEDHGTPGGVRPPKEDRKVDEGE